MSKLTAAFMLISFRMGAPLWEEGQGSLSGRSKGVYPQGSTRTVEEDQSNGALQGNGKDRRGDEVQERMTDSLEARGLRLDTKPKAIGLGNLHRCWEDARRQCEPGENRADRQMT